MRFGVLGHVQVWTEGGEPVAVPETKVRALLADLLAHLGRPLSADRLIDDLWGERLPANPLSALQLKVSRLRHALEDAEAGGQKLVVHRPPGYLLQADAEMVDAGAFEDLTSRARETADPHDRAALLVKALGLWRGPAFADFGKEAFAVPAAHRLEEERLAAVEAQAEARLELGEHGVLVAELSGFVDTYPLRERLRAVLIRALYRAGRQSDALACFADLRKRLADELGLDPSPELLSLHQAVLEQDPALDPPPVVGRSVAVPHSNLPAALTRLIGREEAVGQVRALLDVGRLVTLTGPGGVGKTRMAVETAGQMVGGFPGGVRLVELAGVRQEDGGAAGQDDGSGLGDVSQVALAVMAALDVRDDSAMSVAPLSLVDSLADVLRGKQLLVVLDNCEHIVEPVAKLVERVLMAAPGLRILATSREPLGLVGEVIWAVPPLAIPDLSASAEPAVVQQAGAVQLFVERVRAATPGFGLTADNAAQVVELCRRLDGIPLALELAAVRVRSLGVRELVARLDDRFRLLAGGRTGAPERQRTLRAMIDWSWELLSGPERIVLRRLAVHAEGCTLHAAETVCSGDGIAAEDVLGLVVHLVDRSLVVVIDDVDGPRYRLLESVADYCLHRLREEDELERVQRRHNAYYVALAKQAEPYLRGHQQQRWLERLDRENANLRSALSDMARRDDAAGALELVNALSWYWFLRGRFGEARNALERALTAGGEALATVRATARAWQAGFGVLTGRGIDHSAMKVFQDIQDPRARARAQYFLGFGLVNAARDVQTGGDHVGQALVSLREIDDRWGIAAAVSITAKLALVRGDLRALKRHGQESADLFGALGDRWGQLQASRQLAHLAEVTGDYEQAARLHRDGLRMAEDLRLWTEVALNLAGLGRIALLGRDFTRARELHVQCRRLAIEQNDTSGERFAEIGLALIERREGELELAEVHLTSLLQWHRRLGNGLTPMRSAFGDALILAELGFVAEQRGDVETACARHLESLRAARATGDARAIALALEGMAGAHALAGHHDLAAQLLGTAAAARQAVGMPLPNAERGDVDRITITARTVLGAEVFATAFERGTEIDASTYADDVLRDP